jgi:arsenate reductase
MMVMKRVMFLCTANSCRSQMAEGLMRELAKGRVEVHSAGLFAAGVHPRAAQVMKEIGIDIAPQHSKDIDAGLLREMDYAITLCGNAERTCPTTPPEVRRIHWPIEDPVGARGSEEEVLKEFRRARDEIKKKIEEFLKEEGILS